MLYPNDKYWFSIGNRGADETCECGAGTPSDANRGRAARRNRNHNKIVNGYEPGHSRPWMAMLKVLKINQIKNLIPISLIYRRLVRTEASAADRS